MAQKPPWFKFYATQWLQSHDVQRMTRFQRSIYLDMMAIAWDSDEPGTITLSEDALCRELRIFKSTLREFLRSFPDCWTEVKNQPRISHGSEKVQRRIREGSILVQPRLNEEWVKYQSLQQKRSSRLIDHYENVITEVRSKKLDKETPNPLTPLPFETFWELYPKKVGKPRARKAWEKIPGADTHLGEILSGLELWKNCEQWAKDRGQFIPHPATFLNDRRYNDKPQSEARETLPDFSGVRRPKEIT